jgi:hypothetical protein
MPNDATPPFPGKDQNPYAPPLSDVGPEPLLAGFAPLPFSIGEVLSRTWEIYRARMWSCIGVMFAFFALMMGASFVVGVIPALLRGQAQGVAALVSIVCVLLFLPFVLLVAIGMIIMMLDIAHGREADFGRLFSGGRYLIPLILATILFYLVMGGAALVFLLPASLVVGVLGQNSQAGTIAAGLIFVAFYVLITFLVLRLSQFTYLIIDRNLGALDSLRGSYKITQGHVWQLLGLYLLIQLINMVGLVACLVGAIFTLPYTMLLVVVAYLSLVGSPAAGPNAKGQIAPGLEEL